MVKVTFGPRRSPEADDQVRIENKRLKAKLETLLFAKQQSEREAGDWIAKLENDKLQLHKVWKDEVVKGLDMEKKLQGLK
ncbi:uncharacterized protein PITG_13251 [Phytophthora infestans T30-4]|uniref:Uncharacterized protein n=2 Tax=Phytophthora infestans TaxID=4787 RepID=D0NLI5_PHYIT|nr:uncharacterized protein PITG_13251 [Phytophthora infestans T30-4]EEY60532.1 hypothetical protein PITG_13251 [Phytophthora infestans T30-4]KAF4036318.1 hypothetical protein GN244_ATG11585 [Phytophthora infestans]KAF4129295.1 hypothetical protein GN958_ATG21559 [Phytophthora infestans]KAI9987243.1 hypothetical protein PInf_023212 [Phytophthora infestans]|eukprot:XP_002899905.1 hypothetical protein PITG_13251 [Phytophthora infestans T30-4]